MKLILGCGITGVSVANYLFATNQKFSIADSRISPKLADTLPPCQTFFGKWNTSILQNINQIIVSPGISFDEDIIKWAVQKNIEIICDIDIFYENNPHKTFIGITGTNGKSSTTKLLEFCLQHLGKKAIACGNIGTPILEVDTSKYDIFVVELSSYQLDSMQKTKLDYGVILNITPDHLDRHKTFENYVRAKLKIYQLSQTKIINPNCAYSQNITGVNFVRFNVDIAKTHLLGEHNIQNILATLTICKELGYDENEVFEIVKQFKGLEHRLEFVTKAQHCEYYNDSKATNVNATITALSALQDKYKEIVLILGGMKKDEDYTPLINIINTKNIATILIGASTDFFADTITSRVDIASDFAQVFEILKNNSTKDCVLFSPACASFDMFENFEDRGNQFKQQLLHIL